MTTRPRAGDVAPEAPEVGLGLLLVGRRGDGDDVVLPRVERAGHPADGAALSCGVGAFEDDDQRALALEARLADER